MIEDQALPLTSALAMIVLVGGSLIARRLPIGHMVRLAVLWLAIFAGAFLIVRLLPSFGYRFT